MSAPVIQYPPPSGGGTPIGGTGTGGKLALWAGVGASSTLTDSLLSQDSTTGANLRFNAAASVYAAANRTAIELNGTTSSLLGFQVNGVASGYLTATASSMIMSAGAGRTVQIGANNNVGLTLNTSNFAGFGTADPINRATIVGGAAAIGAAFTNGAFLQDQTNYRGVYLGYDTSGQIGVVAPSTGGSGGASSLAFWTYNGSAWGERARIDSNGILSFAKAVYAAPTSEDFYRLKIEDLGGTANDVGFGSPATGSLGINWSSSGNLIFYQANAAVPERARFDASGNFILNTANTNATIQAAGTGQGLKLPATPGNTDPNTLDCYADGGTPGSGGKTWPLADTSGAGLALTVTKAQYIQVGKQITFTFEVTYPVTADVSNAALSMPVAGVTSWAASGVCYVNSLGLRMWLIAGGNIYFYTTAGLRMTNAQLSGLAIYGGSSYVSA